MIRAAVERAGIAPSDVDQVILGCVGQVAEDAYIARHAAVKAGLPVEVPAYTVNRICGSGLEAINTAARWIECGDAEVIVAGGAENMSMLPFYLRDARTGTALGNMEAEDAITKVLSDPFSNSHMGVTAENLADQYEVPRVTQDEFALRSQERAARGDQSRQVRGRDPADRGQEGPRDGDDRAGRAPARHLDGGAGQAGAGLQARAAASRPATPPASTTAPRRWW